MILRLLDRNTTGLLGQASYGQDSWQGGQQYGSPRGGRPQEIPSGQEGVASQGREAGIRVSQGRETTASYVSWQGGQQYGSPRGGRPQETFFRTGGSGLPG